MIIEGKKYCPKCKTSKLAEDFHKNKNRADGLTGICKECINTKDDDTRQDLSLKANEWHKNHPVQAKANRRRTNLARYGLTPAQFDEILLLQDNKCYICHTDKPGGHGTFHVDHSHVTGKVRGLLCHGCNTALGLLKDNPTLLRLAALYIEERS